MTKENQNFTMWQGEDKTIRAAIVDGNGDPQPLTGYQVTWQVFRSIQAPTAVIQKSVSSGISIISIADVDDGIEISLEDTETEGLEAMEYYHECRVIDGTDKENVVFVGTLTLKPSKTNS